MGRQAEGPGMNLYILDGKTPVPCDDYVYWACWMFDTHDADRHIAHDVVGIVKVSTIFTGLATSDDGPPALFETMVFGGPMNGYQVRCSTWEKAEAMHARVLAQATL